MAKYGLQAVAHNIGDGGDLEFLSIEQKSGIDTIDNEAVEKIDDGASVADEVEDEGFKVVKTRASQAINRPKYLIETSTVAVVQNYFLCLDEYDKDEMYCCILVLALSLSPSLALPLYYDLLLHPRSLPPSLALPL